LTGANGFLQFGLKAIRGERNQSSFLFFKDFANDAGIILWPTPRERNTVAPFERLPIEILQRRKFARGKEGVTNIANGSFDTALLVAASWVAGLSLKMVMAAKL